MKANLNDTKKRSKFWKVMVTIATAAAALAGPAVNTASAQVKNIVLVHGAWADGSGWQAVYKILKADGYNVKVVGNSNFGLPEDAATTANVLARLDGPAILVGHSYGGAIITKAGMSDKVAGLVYVAAFAPDSGETLGDIVAAGKPDPQAGFLPPENGFVWYDKAKFHGGFCADLPADEAEFMADSQIPISVAAFGYVNGEPAWKHKPCWYCVATEDHSIPPAAERFWAKRMQAKVTEIKGSHVIFMSQPQKVAAVIEDAAKNALTATK
jgi:pimeloyl-ACP methyl ester carboxylesterase